MKKIFLTFIYFVFLKSVSFANLEKDLINSTGESNLVSVSGSEDGISILQSIFAWFKDEIFKILPVFVVGVFIYIGYKLIVSEGNEESFKNAIKHFVFVILGIFFVFVAVGLVQIIYNINL